jgi:RNA polymerase sigma factor (sigma-70 family)
MSGRVPLELERLCRADSSDAREAAWADFLSAYNDVLLRAVRFRAEHDGAMDRYTYVLEHLRADDYRRLRQCAVKAPADFPLWLAVTARRLGLDHYRSRYGRGRAGSVESTSRRSVRRRVVDLLSSGVEVDRLLDERTARQDDLLEAQDRATALRSAIAELPARDRLLLRFRFDEGCSAATIARLMAFPTVFHVYRRLASVLAGLRRTLEAKGFDGA